jgi:hypothetical protein
MENMRVEGRNPEFQASEIRLRQDSIAFSCLKIVLFFGMGVSCSYVAEDCFHGKENVLGLCNSSLGRNWLSAKETGTFYVVLSAASYIGALAQAVFCGNVLRGRDV